MIALAERPTPVGAGGGGIAARRAVVRWTWRLFRREWRQQTIVLALITFTVSAALFSVIAAYNLPSSQDARFGTADHIVSLTNRQPAALTDDVAALSAKYGPVETIGHAQVLIPGSVDTFDLRTQDPHGLFAATTLALRHGRYPTETDEVAVTDGVASTFGLHVGDTSSFAAFPATVVGLVENPKDLSDEFILASGSHLSTSTTVTIFVRGHSDQLGAQAGSVRQFQVANTETTATSETPGGVERGTAALLVLALDTVVMLLVSLVAAAAFVVVAQRRLRQLGMLAAMGATRRHLRLAMTAHGVATGVVAAIAGNGIALVGWVALSSRFEAAAGHRIDRADIPWWALAGGTLLAVVTTTAAAWWPARTASRVPVTRALSGRPPRSKRAHRSAIVAVAFLAIGFACLSWGIDSKGTANGPAVIAGLIVVVLGVMFISPIAVRALGATAPRFPVAARLALRDMARQQARAGAALAAVSLGLGIAFAAIIVTTAAAPHAGTGNLSDRQLLMKLSNGEVVPTLTAAERDRLEADIAGFVASLGGAVVYPLDMAVSSDAGGSTGHAPLGDPLGRPGTPAVILGERIADGVRGSAGLYVASPELLAHLGVDLASVDSSAEVLTPRSGDLVLLDPSGADRASAIATAR
ncbi:MAG: putative transport system permease protein, partial [Acidimicrobiaceae bacterium]|nr:putative transport system permease protein [Acidimicrobiaceae bacterium]